MAKKAKKTQKKVSKKSAPAKKNNPRKPSLPKSSIGITPLQDRVVVRHLTEDEMGTKSPSGIIIPDTISKEKSEEGVVVALGPGKFDEDGERRIPMSVEVGDRVMFSKYGYEEVKVGGTEYVIVSESNIIAILTSKAG